MDQALLVEADRVVASLSPGRRETVREIVLDAARRGSLSDGPRRFLGSATGSTLVADVPEAALAQSPDPAPGTVSSSAATGRMALEEARDDG